MIVTDTLCNSLFLAAIWGLLSHILTDFRNLTVYFDDYAQCAKYKHFRGHRTRAEEWLNGIKKEKT